MSAIARFFLGRGTLPVGVRAEVDAEGLLLLEEGVPGIITYRGYRVPGRRYALRETRIAAAVAVTKIRLLVQSRSGPVVNIGWAQPQAAAMKITLEDGRLLIAVDAAAVDSRSSGQVEVRLSTPQAAAMQALVQEELR